MGGGRGGVEGVLGHGFWGLRALGGFLMRVVGCLVGLDGFVLSSGVA